MVKIQYIYCLFLICIFQSCVEYQVKEKRSAGIYEVKLTSVDSANFTNDEIAYYSNLKLHLNYSGDYFLSKKILGVSSNKGIWYLHKDLISGLIVLEGEDKSYYSEISRCEKINGITKLSLPNKNYEVKLPFKKISHEFPELSQ